MVVYELRAIVHLNRPNFESHPPFQHAQELHRLIGALSFTTERTRFLLYSSIAVIW